MFVQKPYRDSHVPFDDSLDDGWNPVGVDDVASWFGQVQSKVHPESEVAAAARPAAEQTTPTSRTTVAESLPSRHEEARTTRPSSAASSRQQSAPKRQNGGRPRQLIAPTSGEHVAAPPTPVASAAPTVPASGKVRLDGIVDYTRGTVPEGDSSASDDSDDDNEHEDATPVNG